jgi:PcRGLX-like protein C-terminal alpha/alpha toroid domain/PcRGLX-like protein central beta sandwich domain/PcRGLX-like N-terminal RIFT barrel domain
VRRASTAGVIVGAALIAATSAPAFVAPRELHATRAPQTAMQATASSAWPLATPAAANHGRVPLRVERAQPDVPVTFGIPMPKGALDNPDHVRVLDATGHELPSQINEVSTWEPADPSVKWIWVFFFTTSGRDYILEYGPDVHRAPLKGPQLTLINNQRPYGGIDVTTGPLRFTVKKGDGSGFLQQVWLDADNNGLTDQDLVATAPDGRGSFLDLVNDEGGDASKAWVRRTLMERGSGPLHAIIRVEGEYRYAKPGHPAAPFVTRIHAYAGRTYLKVDHTFVFTGDPDKHKKQEGEHEHIATSAAVKIITEEPNDPGWMQPNDRLSAAGLAVDLKMTTGLKARSALGGGKWWESAAADKPVDTALEKSVSLLQTGPKPNRIPPVPESTATTHVEGFQAALTADGRPVASGDRAPGWLVVGDGAREVAIAVPRFLEEYPKEIRYEAGRATAFIWSPAVEPMSFARFSSELDREEETIAIENNAQGLAKSSEVVFDFRRAGGASASSNAALTAFLTPPVAHADPAWYGQSGAFGTFAAKSDRYPEFQRALDYKFEWMLFSQRWNPWFGMWDYGDWKLYYDGKAWMQWGNNEPAEDYICWLQFMRTGDARVYDAARASSRHSMDVDNLHWPQDPQWIGDTNSSLDYWNFQKEQKGSPYLGIGSRHANQHWVRTLSAHVWVQGWLADYYLAADHRGLDIAIQTAELHLRRIWGEHGLTGRRLYLGMWNVIEVWDATKDERYQKEVEDYVARVLRLADKDQGGSLTLDRYGYADVYVSHSLRKYLQMTGDKKVAAAVARHARRVRDVPPLNHEMESYLSSIYTLVLGYELTGDPGMLAEIKHRMEPLVTDPIARPLTDPTWTSAEMYEALEKVSHLPKSSSNRFRARAIWSATNGLRVYGWTHAYTLPYALDLLERVDKAERKASPRPSPAVTTSSAIGAGR